MSPHLESEGKHCSWYYSFRFTLLFWRVDPGIMHKKMANTRSHNQKLWIVSCNIQIFVCNFTTYFWIYCLLYTRGGAILRPEETEKKSQTKLVLLVITKSYKIFWQPFEIMRGSTRDIDQIPKILTQIVRNLYFLAAVVYRKKNFEFAIMCIYTPSEFYTVVNHKDEVTKLP